MEIAIEVVSERTRTHTPLVASDFASRYVSKRQVSRVPKWLAGAVKAVWQKRNGNADVSGTRARNRPFVRKD